ncbi:hypothetical protein TrispH2_007735 [Trichoplax sp. H2]|uniref:Hexosyltransferase n=1 Tax=Trichoplax adhaerens TaxID=10228 RepID=B3RXN1_TRIAD|nr:hypothetical protein TRIADDRAFT_56266 [Trichoplax adhaerens]EDV24458.1 hypothetical protein TRIADDRAFT_56266 [Trichoplax adhaerens]RDD41080.1 hypothetical protein TrispH2_007735 [Trichoplax sp. H2]|eukprot:XP_002112348.1 hypothetical protein TRIADDRAFT_56266 [Trichoplax adhaerens]
MNIRTLMPCVYIFFLIGVIVDCYILIKSYTPHPGPGGYQIIDSWSDDISRPMSGENFHLAILVDSKPQNVAYRSGIRRSWGNSKSTSSKKAWDVFFIYAKHKNSTINRIITDEAEKKKDCLILDDVESKSIDAAKLVSGMKWLLDHTTFDYLLVTTDISYVNVNAAVRLLKQLEHDHRTTDTVTVAKTSKVRNMADKGGSGGNIIDSVYIGNVKAGAIDVGALVTSYSTVQYCTDLGYILSRDVVSEIVQLFLTIGHTPKKAKSDIFIGYMANKLQHTPVHSKFLEGARKCNEFKKLVMDPELSDSVRLKINKRITKLSNSVVC